MNDRIHTLLDRVAAGDASDDVLAELRDLLVGVLDVPPAVLFVDDPVGDAVALRDVFSGPGIGLDVALRAEAGDGPDVGASVDPAAVPVAVALRDEAGRIDVVEDVLSAVGVSADDRLPEGWLSALLDRALPASLHVAAAERVAADPELRTALRRMADVGREVRDGVLREAAPPPSLWAAVAKDIGIADPESVPGYDGAVVREAVLAEAGSVNVAGKVMDAVMRDARGPAPIPLDESANDVSWRVALVAVAAVALMVIGPRVIGLLASGTTTTAPDVAADFVSRPVEFATRDEINVDRIQYGANSTVFVETPQAADEPLILWIDDGADL